MKRFARQLSVVTIAGAAAFGVSTSALANHASELRLCKPFSEKSCEKKLDEKVMHFNHDGNSVTLHEVKVTSKSNAAMLQKSISIQELVAHILDKQSRHKVLVTIHDLMGKTDLRLTKHPMFVSGNIKMQLDKITVNPVMHHNKHAHKPTQSLHPLHQGNVAFHHVNLEMQSSLSHDKKWGNFDYMIDIDSVDVQNHVIKPLQLKMSLTKVNTVMLDKLYHNIKRIDKEKHTMHHVTQADITSVTNDIIGVVEAGGVFAIDKLHVGLPAIKMDGEMVQLGDVSVQMQVTLKPMPKPLRQQLHAIQKLMQSQKNMHKKYDPKHMSEMVGNGLKPLAPALAMHAMSGGVVVKGEVMLPKKTLKVLLMHVDSHKVDGKVINDRKANAERLYSMLVDKKLVIPNGSDVLIKFSVIKGQLLVNGQVPPDAKAFNAEMRRLGH